MPKRKPFIVDCERNMQLAVERIERAWWREPLQIALAELERTGDRTLVDDLVRLFKKIEALGHYPH